MKNSMDKKLSETESIMVGKWVEERNFDKLEDWIEDNPDKAKIVFSQYRSLAALEEMEAVIYPSKVERVELAGEWAKRKVKKIIISWLEQGLKLISGEEYQQFPEPGFARSDQGMESLNFVGFKIFLSNKKDFPYELKLNKSEYVTIDKIGEIKEERVYQGRKITKFSLSLQAGKYRIEVDQESWELELK